MTPKLGIAAAQAGPQVAATVIILYRPEDEDLTNLARLASPTHPVIAVVNALTPEQKQALPVQNGLTFLHNDENVGLASALNQGLAQAIEGGSDYVLLLDQDSRPATDMIDQMVVAATAIEAEGRQLACVAPVLCDRKIKGSRIGECQAEVMGTATFATSGTLITRQGWQNVGPMWSELFIDGIDHEWCFRARARGFETVLLRHVSMEHDMGEGAINFFGRFKPVHRSPIRHYFIVRNILWLSRRRYIPLGWRVREVAKLAYRIPVYVFGSSHRAESAINVLRAIIDGLLQRDGRLGPS